MNHSVKDVCSTSINLLEKRFNEIRKTKVFIPDIAEPVDFDETVDSNEVLLMGRYFERIFQLEYWPKSSFYFYCLSTQVRKILIEVFNFSPEAIGHISRYDLFPTCTSEVKEFNLNESTHFYHAGRISPQKNIEFIIFTVFYLQIFFSKNIKLSLFGNFDNEYHRDRPGFRYIDYELKINKIIANLPWVGEKPQFFSNLNQDEWLMHIPIEGIFFSASKLISEDFSVSGAQVQQKGLPLLIPWWGGFKDLVGENIKHYHSSLIATSHASVTQISSHAKAFAMNLKTKESGTLFSSGNETMKTIIPTQKIDRNYLRERIEFNIKNLSPNLELISENNLPLFASSDEGQNILSNCRKIFAE